ncbi:serine hydrolase [Nonomuraea ferruginea]
MEPWLPELADRRVLRRIDGPLDDTVPARRPITVRDLLTSTFGLGMDMMALGTPIMNAVFERGLTPNLPVPMPEPDEWMRRLGELPLMHQPGEHWQYQISNDLLGVLVARVTGRSFEDFPARARLRPARDERHRFPRARRPARPAAGSLRPRPADRRVPGVGRGQGRAVERAAGCSREAAAGWCPPSTTTTPTSGCCSTAGCTKGGGSCRGPPSSS